MASILRLSAQKAPMAFARSFSVSAVKMDLVQDLYVNQLKSYKPAAKAADAHVGSVRSFTAPKAPSAPALPTDLASELSKFDAEEPTIGGSAPKTSASSEGGESVEEYLAFLEKDLPKADAHH
ncbi:F-type H+-transporting ATPase subunit H [Cryptococcus neoformans C23]|uniref:F-type H-transporting ATPase subunit H n=2 Tax=Cryptococcus neoformans TaxID=5207 RepID=J9VL03_CRYN9|nr:F-type H -transporting ATPase subunit H [Cryptococcus neoformans var. grubii H99]XP_012049238.1 F-type H -transporting ATPase subunit H, variant [Cryptococcus neoformans var. grubii H99]AUB24914.1 F-type H -transporting ATPase subunit H [Cryptococcus neoformans var. grubii]OWZ32611.1 F-type H+-transporting ATPase subunit H [Cryptococcus neoformans var. grubii AD2-60a]OWZ43497.1 F-type H+-transporting ATPase subunit H [Cryptococcus neoformans var. grubii AD1-83a]OWZ44458.1 F-type H+-transpor|eukprot:XP_012049237.1 F-type H -transporting ATPase subunit H [Cryptococcus neoformans var. grubii H99]